MASTDLTQIAQIGASLVALCVGIDWLGYSHAEARILRLEAEVTYVHEATGEEFLDNCCEEDECRHWALNSIPDRWRRWLHRALVAGGALTAVSSIGGLILVMAK